MPIVKKEKHYLHGYPCEFDMILKDSVKEYIIQGLENKYTWDTFGQLFKNSNPEKKYFLLLSVFDKYGTLLERYINAVRDSRGFMDTSHFKINVGVQLVESY